MVPAAVTVREIMANMPRERPSLALSNAQPAVVHPAGPGGKQQERCIRRQPTFDSGTVCLGGQVRRFPVPPTFNTNKVRIGGQSPNF